MIKVSDLSWVLNRIIKPYIGSYTPYVTYGEVTHSIQFVSIIDDNIVVGENLENFTEGNKIYKYETLDGLMCIIEYFNIPNIKFQDYTGDLYDIKDIIIDFDLKRLILVGDYKIK